MYADLERRASQAVHAARLLERAVHDSGPWTMAWGPHEVGVDRIVSQDRVTFYAAFPESCYLERPPATVFLRCDGEDVAVQQVVYPGDGRFFVEWVIRPGAIKASERS